MVRLSLHCNEKGRSGEPLEWLIKTILFPQLINLRVYKAGIPPKADRTFKVSATVHFVNLESFR